MRDDGKPALIFAAHLANWELPALVAARLGSTPPSSTAGPTSARSDAFVQVRTVSMGTLISTGLDAPLKLRRAAERRACRDAGRPVYVQGVDVTFFGRSARPTP